VRIVFLVESLKLAKAEHVMLKLVQALREKGRRTHMITLQEAKASGERPRQLRRPLEGGSR
jgi:hypothetical protein